jgi:hypothetical protein
LNDICRSGLIVARLRDRTADYGARSKAAENSGRYGSVSPARFYGLRCAHESERSHSRANNQVLFHVMHHIQTECREALISKAHGKDKNGKRQSA